MTLETFPEATDFGPAASPAPAPLPARSTCAGRADLAGTHDWSLEHAGRTRRYRVHVPPDLGTTRPLPVVFAFHGYAADEREQEALSGLTREADARGFIAVYPQGLNQPELTGGGDADTRAWNAGICCGPARDAHVDDVGFVDALIAQLDARLCVDSHRLFATGYSNGAFFAYRLACERSEHFAAIAPVAGMEGYGPCTPTRPVPVMHFHGTEDRTIRYPGGTNELLTAPYPSAAESVARWAERNDCRGRAFPTYIRGDSTCDTFTPCADNAAVSLCTSRGAGHTWPGGEVPVGQGRTTTDLDASREMWRFFTTHPRP
jgi:polyhydroxybutyrate depolymerase